MSARRYTPLFCGGASASGFDALKKWLPPSTMEAGNPPRCRLSKTHPNHVESRYDDISDASSILATSTMSFFLSGLTLSKRHIFRHADLLGKGLDIGALSQQ